MGYYQSERSEHGVDVNRDFPNDQEKDVFPNPNIFVHFAQGLQEKMYGDIASYEQLYRVS